MDGTVRQALLRHKARGKSIIITGKDIIAWELRNNTLFRKWRFDVPYNQNRVLGMLGETGSSKSIGAATIAFIDYMLMGQPCYSNLDISYDMEIPEALIQEYEYYSDLPILREPVHYKSIPIDFKEMLSFSPKYQNGVVLIDEINIALADAWRTMTNQALAAADWIQQLRKMHCAMIHTCIDEMFVPNRIRDGTDLYIKCRDIAYYSQFQHQNPGVTFEWKLYPITGKFFGYENTYGERGIPFETWYFKGRKSWDLVDTWERQHRKRMAISPYENEEVQEKVGVIPEVDRTPEHQEVIDTYGWIYETKVVGDLVNGEEMERWDLIDALAREAPENITEFKEKDILSHIEKAFEPRIRWSGGKKFYSVVRRERELVGTY